MQDLEKKLDELVNLIKAMKLNSPSGPKMPTLPAVKAPPQPSMTPSKTAAPKIGTGEGPNSKKDPKKVAQQIKDGTMSTKTQKVMLKTDEKTGQWSLEHMDKAKVDEGKSIQDKQAARATRQGSWERENMGTHSSAHSKIPEVSTFLHQAKLSQIKRSPKPKLPEVVKAAKNGQWTLESDPPSDI